MSAISPVSVPFPTFVFPSEEQSQSVSVFAALPAVVDVKADDLHVLGNDVQVDRQRLVEFVEDLKSIAMLEPGWDGGREKVPDDQLLLSAARLGQVALASCQPRPHCLNLHAVPDGSISMTMVGTHGRQVELLLEEPGRFTAISKRPDDDFDEAELRIEEFDRVRNWLRNESATL